MFTRTKSLPLDATKPRASATVAFSTSARRTRRGGLSGRTRRSSTRGPTGAQDPSEKTKLARWRKQERIFGKLNEQDGGVMIAVRPGTKVPIMADDPYAVGTAALDSGDDHERHLALELKLRKGPALGDGSWDKPLVRFSLTMAEWEELSALREMHGWGAEIGKGASQLYWRSAGELADKMVVTGEHRFGSRVVMPGRALA